MAETLTVNGRTVELLGRLNRPQPTLFVFAGTRADTLNPSNPYNDVGRILVEKKWLVVTLDLPCHGEDSRPGEPAQLAGWRYRHETLGEDVVGHFTSLFKSVTDKLITERYTRHDQIFVAGTSRGGFLAAHCAIADARVRGFLGFAPVTDLLKLSEYASSNFPNHAVIPSFSLRNYATDLSRIPFVLYSGPADSRVDSNETVALMGLLALDSFGVLKVSPAAGHSVPNGAHHDAARWILEKRKARF